MKLAEYKKLIAAVVGLVLMLLHRKFGLDLSGQESAIVDIVLATLTAYGVYQAPNKRKATK